MNAGSSALEWLLVTQGVKPETARAASAVLYVVVSLALVVALVLFIEWRFVAFEQKGCAAWCDCVARMGNTTYSLPPPVSP